MPENKKVNIDDVAKRAGVSIATISRYLNGQLNRMSTKTADKIAKIIDEMEYVPNAAARQLVTQSSHLIAVIAFDIDDYFTSEFFKGISEILATAGYTPVLFDSNSDAQRERELLKIVSEQNFDGLIMQPILHDAAELKELLKREMSMITLDREIEGFPAVITNNETIATQMAQHFRQQGYERMIIVTNPIDQASTRAQRIRGIEAVFSDAPILEVPQHGQQDAFMVSGIQNLIAGRTEKVVVFVLKENLLMKLLGAPGRETLWHNPQITFSGFADTNAFSLLTKPLALVKQQPYLMGATAAELLLKKFSGQAIEPRTIIPALFHK